MGKSRKFSKRELRDLSKTGPLLAAAYDRLSKESLVRTDRDFLSAVSASHGNLCFLAGSDGVLVGGRRAHEIRLEAILGGNHSNGLPGPLKTVAKRLIRSLLHEDGDSIISQEVAVNGHRCRVFVAALPVQERDGPIFEVVVSCIPAPADMRLLARDGLTEKEIAVLEHMQEDQSTKSLCKRMGKSGDTIEYYFRRIGRKLGVTGRAAIIARAIARSQELAIELGLRSHARAA